MLNERIGEGQLGFLCGFEARFELVTNRHQFIKKFSDLRMLRGHFFNPLERRSELHDPDSRRESLPRPALAKAHKSPERH